MRLHTILLVTITIVLLPKFLPIARILPLPIGENVRKSYDVLKSLKAGDTLWIPVLPTQEYWSMYGGVFIGIFTMMLENGVNVVFTGSGPQQVMDFNRLVAATPLAVQLDSQGKGYGTRWIFLAFHPSGESELYSLLSNLKIGLNDAVYNRPYSDYPIMTTLNDASDLKAMTGYTSDFRLWIRVYVDNYKGVFVPVYTEDFAVESMVWLGLGKLGGTVMGINDAAAFEKLADPGYPVYKPALEVASTNNLIGMWFLACIVIANIRFLDERRAARAEARVKT